MSFTSSPLGWEYSKFCKIRGDSISKGRINLSNEEWFYPTSLLPLKIFIKNSGLEIDPPSNEGVQKYFSIITDGWLPPFKGTYIPIIKVPTDKRERDNMFEPLNGFDDRGVVGGKDAVSFLVQELVDNVYEHSEFSSAYVIAQKYQKKKFVEISIIDNGISIPGSLENAGHNFEDAKAIYQATQGLSTKTKERGY